MQKTLLYSGAIIIGLLFFLSPSSVSAQTTCAPCPANAICNPLNVCSFEDLINIITNFIFWVALALAPLLFLIAGFYILTAGGDPNRVTTGKRIMIYTLIGFSIILFARGLIALLENVLGVQ